jgi:inhibitor of cysteine peptidase
MINRYFLRFLSCGALLSPLLLFVAAAKTIPLDESDNRSHICLYTGHVLTIKLACNPTTGFSWGQTDFPTNLELLSSKSEPGATDRVGAPGAQVFSFKASKAGESTLTLNNSRPFEKNLPSAKTFRLTLTVQTRPASSDAAGKP